MTASQPRLRRALALPLGMAMATAVAFLPDATASAAPAVTTTAAAPASDADTLSYVVNVRPGHGLTAQVRTAIAKAGGTVVTSYDRIGVIVVHSANPDFATALRKVRGVDSAGATRTAPLPAQSTTDTAVPQPLTAAQLAQAQREAADGQDPLEPLQWDLPAIKADQAHRTTLGSPEVTVGVIDTGVDDTHPDIAPNFDRRASVNCVSGKPDRTDGAWRPGASESPHGTHVAGEIAGAKNGVGVTGVAPGVKVAGIKVSTPEGFFYTEAVVCGLMWAADHGIDVTNNSYYTDPWYFNCVTDPDQKALVEAVRRAAQYAEKRGTVNVAAAGNENYDLASRTLTDPSSPNDSTPGDRVVDTRSCFDIPTQLPGVVTVAATGAKGIKSSYSNYGRSVIDIAAPGGDSTAYQTPPAPATSGSILGPLPGGTWGYMSGTSMATPHVAGVAALIKSTHPHASAAQVKALLYAEATRTPCTDPYDIDGDGKIDAVCEGPTNRNGFYGRGIVDALAAVTK
ncbi:MULTISPECIES: S8 family peptidase [Streptomyces]|uniref:S8 family serine peptidase n=1 Tax=Streptomyces thermoviolaceus subsp. thermoviolaceus TaxID=66860 RepID=A0ABX0YTE5_STRTL|nr:MULTISPECIES: S8 family serine peptidase [Streptomyces]WTD49774.1 S8 family serine peptidase [Streptomyces thermoviolaceus]NJP14348.1 S8 family serine peptidase [Streptomyces thermoviolaceus subsp. thermoviolaceus]RSS00714.1 peptidase S8 [Streptomyces sp. WAC00469]GGV81459.1 peptidase S8 [Streptomyces thermoviolaceus subsp. apingens]GHA78016.1 peptidase S8 [Streptomyces thermoviolaceus subsp. thermoviolaceus]